MENLQGVEPTHIGDTQFTQIQPQLPEESAVTPI